MDLCCCVTGAFPKEAIGKSFIKRVGYGAVLFSLRQEALEMRRLMNREKRVPEPITRVINEGVALQDDSLGGRNPFLPAPVAPRSRGGPDIELGCLPRRHASNLPNAVCMYLWSRLCGPVL